MYDIFNVIIRQLEKFGFYYQSHKDELSSLHKEYYKIHTKQRSNWDCGIACLQMASKWSSYCKDDFKTIILDHEISVRTTPLWTIDLYCFLRENNVNSIMYTTTIGISSSHRELGWYQNHLSDDINRVNSKFQLAKDQNWIINNIIVDLNIVADAIENGASAIILVDNILFHKTNHDKHNDDIYNYNEEKSNESLVEYAGHYIFLIEYDPTRKFFTYLDPAVNACTSTVSYDTLDSARSHTGTDFDIIIINR